MGEIVNLRRVRKAKARSDAQTEAAANRVSHGRTKVEKLTADDDRRRAKALLDGVKLNRD